MNVIQFRPSKTKSSKLVKPEGKAKLLSFPVGVRRYPVIEERWITGPPPPDFCGTYTPIAPYGDKD